MSKIQKKDPLFPCDVRTAISKKKIHEHLVSSTVVYPHFAEEKKQSFCQEAPQTKQNSQWNFNDFSIAWNSSNGHFPSRRNMSREPCSFQRTTRCNPSLILPCVLQFIADFVCAAHPLAQEESNCRCRARRGFLQNALCTILVDLRNTFSRKGS